MSKPKAVLISDVHYSLNSLEVADTAFRMAIDLASQLGVPLIDCGDVTNDKAILRAEVANRMLETIDYAADLGVDLYFLVGNHSLLNEKGKEHALHFLKNNLNVCIISAPTYDKTLNINFIPYQSSKESFMQAFDKTENKALIICHQGFKGAYMGEYLQDKSSVDPELLKDHTIYSGHYHRRQKIGTVQYIGTPYTTSFAEANDGAKGCLILNHDNTCEFVPFDLRKHIIIEIEAKGSLDYINPDGKHLLWVKARGSKLELEQFSKKIGPRSFKLDLILTEETTKSIDTNNLTDVQILDSLIDETNESEAHKQNLKELYKELLT